MAEYSISCEVSDFNSTESYGSVAEEMKFTPPSKIKTSGPALWRISQALGTDAKATGNISWDILDITWIVIWVQMSKSSIFIKDRNLRQKSQLNSMAKGADKKLKEFAWPLELVSLVNYLHDVPRSRETNGHKSLKGYYMKMLEIKTF